MSAAVIGTTVTGHDIWGGTSADRTALGVKPALTQFQEIGGNLYESNGAAWITKSISGAGLVINDMVQGFIMGKRIVATHIREINVLTTTAETLDWSTTPIAGVSLVITQEGGGTAEYLASVAICVDPPNSSVRDAWLTAGDSLTADSQRYGVPINQEGSLTFDGENISYLGIKQDGGTGNLRVFAVGYEVEA